MRITRSTALAAAVVIAGAMPFSGVKAQQGAAGLEEIVVTARKREESLQDIPISVTAFSAATIEELQIRDADDLALYTPGFSFISSFGRDSISNRPVVRGMANILGEANASFFIDGIYVPGAIASTELQDLERVEVIKGPQAALYGRATFSGAINFITKRPSNEREAKISVSGAEHEQFDLLASFSGPLIEDRVFYYLAASHYEYGGEYRNLIDDKDVGAEETDAVTAKLVFASDDGFEGSVRVTWQQDDDNHIAMWLQGADFNNCFEANDDRPAARGYYCGTVRVNDEVEARTDFLDEPGVRRDIFRSAITMDWNFGNGSTLHSVTGVQSEDTKRQIDVSYAAYDPLLYLYGWAFIPDPRGAFWRVQEEDIYTVSQELRLSSATDRDLRWTLGGYYYRSTLDQTVDDRINPLVDTVAELDPAMRVQQGNSFPETLITENMAIFGGVEYDFSDRLTGTVELRYAEDRKSADFFPTVGSGGVETIYLDETFDNVTPRVTLTWKRSEDMTIYGNIAKGNKPGGFNDPGAPVIFYEEEESLNFELGLKSRLRDGSVQWNTALFFIDWDDQQLTLNATRADGTITSFIENIGKTEVLGLETELTARISDNWDLSVNYAYIDSEIQEYVNAQQALFFGCVPPPTGSVDPVLVQGFLDCVDANGSVAGNDTPRSSKHQASFRTRYSWPRGNGREWFVGANATYESSRFAQVHNLAETGDATRVGLQLGFRSERFDAMLWGKNIFDDDTALDILRYIDTRGYNAAPFIPCPPVPFVFRGGENCGPNFLRMRDSNGNTIIPRGFGITLPRGRQIGVTLNVRF